jgi:RNA polymerase sigma-70 factor, ECF subfamily
MTVAPAALSDSQLMAEVSAGSVEAFGELYDRYCARAYGVALSVCRDEGRAQDAVQDGFLSVWKSRATYRARRGTVAAWLLTVVRHRAIDLKRRNEKHDAYRASDEELDVRFAPDDVCAAAIKRDDADRLQASLALLPDVQHEVISLAFYDELSHTEIATRLDLPAGTVKGRMRLGLQKLKANSDWAAA